MLATILIFQGDTSFSDKTWKLTSPRVHTFLKGSDLIEKIYDEFENQCVKTNTKLRDIKNKTFYVKTEYSIPITKDDIIKDNFLSPLIISWVKL